jgi:hypothetical protein
MSADYLLLIQRVSKKRKPKGEAISREPTVRFR